MTLYCAGASEDGSALRILIAFMRQKNQTERKQMFENVGSRRHRGLRLLLSRLRLTHCITLFP